MLSAVKQPPATERPFSLAQLPSSLPDLSAAGLSYLAPAFDSSVPILEHPAAAYEKSLPAVSVSQELLSATVPVVIGSMATYILRIILGPDLPPLYLPGDLRPLLLLGPRILY